MLEPIIATYFRINGSTIARKSVKKWEVSVSSAVANLWEIAVQCHSKKIGLQKLNAKSTAI